MQRGDKVRVVDSYLAGLEGIIIDDHLHDLWEFIVKTPSGSWGFNEDELVLIDA